MSEMQKTDVHIRWMTRRDLSAVLGIEQVGLIGRWEEIEFLEAMRDARTIGIVAEVAGQVVGYAVYTLTTREIIVHRLVVHCDHTRRGVGRLLLARIVRRMVESGRQAVSTRIPAWNDTGRSFLEAVSWECRESAGGQLRFEFPG